MRRILRDNPLLAVSIALPVVVVLLFVGATAIPRLMTDPPAHDLLLTVQSGDASRALPVRILLGVEEGKVVARASKLEQYQPGYAPRLFRYDHESGSVREINIPVSRHAQSLDDGDVIPIPELEGVRVSPELRAPDGYEYRGRNYDRGFMMELFGSARSGRRITVAKGGAIVPIHLPETDYWYYGANFLGWVVGEQD